MNADTFEHNRTDLQRFFPLYCDAKHCESVRRHVDGMMLCASCETLYMYALTRLSECPLDPKPKCRKCSVRCYDKKAWKAMAAVMRYGGLRLGIIKIRKKLGLTGSDASASSRTAG